LGTNSTAHPLMTRHPLSREGWFFSLKRADNINQRVLIKNGNDHGESGCRSPTLPFPALLVAAPCRPVGQSTI
jgi:hypothetical protein